MALKVGTRDPGMNTTSDSGHTVRPGVIVLMRRSRSRMEQRPSQFPGVAAEAGNT
jgi:hypothetical protein